jgi:rfaE bifunctional protein kinase chain/domain
MSDRLDRPVLPDLTDAKVAVAGDFCLDAYWRLVPDVDERSIETSLPIRRVDTQRYELGGAGNVVANLMALGVSQVRAIGLYGSDPFAPLLLRLLRNLNVDTASMIDAGPDWQTSVYAKPIEGGDEQSRIDFGSLGAPPAAVHQTLRSAIAAAADWADVVVVVQQIGGWFANPTVVAEFNSVIEANPTAVFLVDARNTAGGYRGAMLKLNLAELADMMREELSPATSTEEIVALAQRVFESTKRPVFVTRGDRGIVAVDRDRAHVVLGIEVLGQIDAVGAGDTATASIAAVIAGGGDVELAATVANLAAAVTIRKLNRTGVASPQEIHNAAADVNYIFSPDAATDDRRRELVPETSIELVTPIPRGGARISHAVFDHDGTLSTLRQGWDAVMRPMMVNAVTGWGRHDVDLATYQEIGHAVAEMVDRTTGIQTIAQMGQLVELVKRFGIVPPDQRLDAAAYKAIYLAELAKVIEERVGQLTAGHLCEDDFRIKGSKRLLEELREREITMYLVSGTDQDAVVAEASAIGLAEFFGERIFGAQGNSSIDAKRVVLTRLVHGFGLRGNELVTFGDGPVEMRETRRVDGIAIGVCSDEVRRYGFNMAKRARLIRGGAMALIPDFMDQRSLLRLLYLGE